MSVTVVFVPLAAGAKFRSGALKSAYAECWPDEVPPTLSSASEGQLSADFADDKSVLMQVVPVPFPEPDLKHALAGTWLWPNAEAELTKQRGHLIVTTFGFDDEDEIGRATLLTRFLTALFRSTPQALGVLWSSASMLIKAGVFADLAHSQLPDTRPLWLWVNFQVGAATKGRFKGATRGMAPFGHRDFETDTSTDDMADLRDRLTGLCRYVLDNGPVILDGDTIGSSATEHIKIRYGKSLFGFDEEVMRLEYSPIKRRK